MGIKVTDVQGVKVYLAPQGADVTTIAKVETAIGTAKQVNCLQVLGNVSASRASTDYSCLSSDEVAFSLGSVTYADQAIDVLYDGTDTSGKQDLIDAFENKERRQIIIEFNDKPNSNVGSSPTYITYEVGFKQQDFTFEKDAAIMVRTVAKPTKPKRFKAVAAA